MKKIFFIIIILLPVLWSCNDLESLEENTNQVEEGAIMDGEIADKKLNIKPRWRKIKEFKGTNTIETPSFKIKGKEWQIKWSVKPTDDNSEFILILYDSNNPDYMEVIANTEDQENDFAYLEGKGEYYLSINAKNVKYKVSIEEVKY